MDDLELRDCLVADAVAPAKEQGREVNVQKASDYIVSVLQEMDRKEQPRRASSSTKKPGSVAKEYEKRSGERLGDWVVDREPPVIKDARSVRQKGYERLQRRIRWILSKPDLKLELKGLAPALVGGSQEAKERAAEKVRALIAKSDRLYGREWWKPEPKRLWSR